MDNLLCVFHPEPVSKMNFDLGEYFTSVTDIDNNLIFYNCLIIANTTDGIFDGEYFLCRFSYQTVNHVDTGDTAEEWIYENDYYNSWDVCANYLDRYIFIR